MYRLLRAPRPGPGTTPGQARRPATGQARAGRHRPQPGVVLGHHQAGRAPQVDLVPPLRDPRRLQPLRRRLARRPPRVGPPRRRAHRRRRLPTTASAAGQLALHADRGSSMTSKTVSQLLADLGVLQSHSRPHQSNDNPYSEAHFKTLKYFPTFPKRFASIAARPQLHRRLLRPLQPPAPPLRHRPAHPRRRPPRPRRRRPGPTPSRPRRRLHHPTPNDSDAHRAHRDSPRQHGSTDPRRPPPAHHLTI